VKHLLEIQNTNDKMIETTKQFIKPWWRKGKLPTPLFWEFWAARGRQLPLFPVRGLAQRNGDSCVIGLIFIAVVKTPLAWAVRFICEAVSTHRSLFLSRWIPSSFFSPAALCTARRRIRAIHPCWANRRPSGAASGGIAAPEGRRCKVSVARCTPVQSQQGRPSTILSLFWRNLDAHRCALFSWWRPHKLFKNLLLQNSENSELPDTSKTVKTTKTV
jgi:hypothetical protein